MIWYKIVKFTGKQIPITSTVDSLYPTVTLYEDASVLANFGDCSAKPFCYDIKKCPGLVFKWGWNQYICQLENKQI
jgi:hypothetical protein